MRLWHQDLIRFLPRQQLLGQHRECCALRGKSWGKKHSVVDYVFKYAPDRLYEYHLQVMYTMSGRGYEVDPRWYLRTYRGPNLSPWRVSEVGMYLPKADETVYPEHDMKYMVECLDNLDSKGAELVGGESIASLRLKLAVKYGV